MAVISIIFNALHINANIGVRKARLSMMTREEAIEMLEKDKEQRGNCFISDALDMAIKALNQEPCDDAISRQAVLDIAKSSKSNWIDNSVLFKKVNALPSVNQESKVGHWIKHSFRNDWNNFDEIYYECSECNEKTTYNSNYCPNCGVKMGN